MYNKQRNGERGCIACYLNSMNFINNCETSIDNNWKILETGDCGIPNIAK